MALILQVFRAKFEVHMINIFILLVSVSLVYSQCPTGYSVSSDLKTCYRVYPVASKHSDASGQCSEDGGKLVSIHSAFQNAEILSLAEKQNTQIWLGIKCAGSQPALCAWDDGTGNAAPYNNFYTGNPNFDLGECVYMSISGSLQGQWLSNNCDLTSMGYACMMPAQGGGSCTDYTSFNNFCYKSYGTNLPYASAETVCQQNCGNLVSIHSADENYFVQSLFGQSPPLYTWTGLLESSNGTFQWVDNSPYDYSHFGHNDLRLGSCVTMALQQEIVPAGQWVNANCENIVQFVCKRAPGACTNPTTGPSPTGSAPPICDGPQFLDGQGNFYSPNYPNSYAGHSQTCDYILTVPKGYNAAITFPEFNLDLNSKIELYDTITDPVPFQTLTGKLGPFNWYVSTTDTMKVIFRESNPQPLDNYRWSAYFQANGTVNPTNSPVTVTPDPSNPSGCNAGVIYAPGKITSKNWPNDYPDLTECAYLLQAQSGYKINLSFNQITTEQCCDIIQVFDGPGRGSNLLDRLSGNIASGVKSFKSTGQNLYVLFSTDSNIHYSGWSANFNAVY